ncbi:UNVERIFIED_CONTAM: hypothetical protein PYX00_005485 [Menopon gallinae]|uniref:Glutathione S-transferase n=1 Tax=Menopon gallinae TaxID=328185 RepID=A0AAW2HSW9_9NEOP
MTITLYTFPPSPPARAAVMAARAVGVDVNLKEINLFQKEQLSPEFIKVNPQHTVPTLDDNGFVLWESRAIAGYLAKQYGKDDSLYPQNPQLKAVVDQRLYFDCTTLYPRLRAICFPVLFLGETKITQEKRDSLNEAISFLEKFLHGRKWLTGDNYTIADISTFATMSSAVAMGWTVDNFPNVKEWMERCKTLPGYEENAVGAKIFGDAVRKNLEPGQV